MNLSELLQQYQKARCLPVIQTTKVIINHEAETFWLTRWLSEPAGIGRIDGEHGKRSRGEPLSEDNDLPSPRLCQTSALGHEMTTAWMTAERPRIRLRCWGQLHSSVYTVTAVLTGNAVVDVTVADAELVLLTLSNSALSVNKQTSNLSKNWKKLAANRLTCYTEVVHQIWIFPWPSVLKL